MMIYRPIAEAAAGTAMAAWAAMEAVTRVVAQAPIGGETGVSVVWVFQVGVLVVAGVILVRFGMLLAGWQSALQEIRNEMKVLSARTSESEHDIEGLEDREGK